MDEARRKNRGMEERWGKERNRAEECRKIVWRVEG